MIVVNGAVIVGEDDHEYIVDARKCSNTTDGPHFCVHDWRIEFGNVERTDQ